MLDDTDRRILRQWLAAPEASGTELAARTGLSPAALSRRIDRLKREGVVKGVRAVIDWRALGYAVEVSLRITLDKTQDRAFDAFISAAREVPEVTQIQTFLGRVDVRLQVLARDMRHYQQVYRDRILTLPHIADIEALMQVAAIKTEQVLPV
jgi:Lrp/AsnC family transcriptional regulator